MEQVVSVVVPAYNEEDRIINTLQALKEIQYIDKIIVVDDGSIDRTYVNASSVEGICLIKQSQNKGKGQALKVGVQEALKDSDIVVFADADLQSSAKEVRKLIEPIINGEADVTIARFPAAKRKGGFGLVKKLARYGVYLYSGKKLSSVLSGQRAFRKEVIEDIGIQYNGYGIELGMTIDILKKGYHIKEVDVEMYHNETGRNLKGFIHRGKQFLHIFMVLVQKAI